ncbi:DUF397 domain-containing protein [Streptomyces sp. NPDC089919]|uniref:DUF397 domain-containing protein n=1 Tax=Streptomyces sp. NPDC089919 TaxID=3155188 RepID=UPI003440FC87
MCGAAWAGGNRGCVEVADAVPGAVPVRDSKDVEGQVLIFHATVWSTFVADLKVSADL